MNLLDMKIFFTSIGIGFIWSFLLCLMKKPEINFYSDKYTVSVPAPGMGRFAVFHYDFMEMNGLFIIKPRIIRVLVQISIIVILELLVYFTGLAEKAAEECNVYIIFLGFWLAIYLPPLVMAHIWINMKRNEL